MSIACTPAERKALLFLSGVLCLGAGVRVAGAVRHEPPPAESRAALARQIDAVDSARRAAKAGKERARERRARRGAREVAGARPADGSRAGVGNGGDSRLPTPHAAFPTLQPRAPGAEPLDLDTASAPALERLPRVGSALARRIVEERARNGAYGSLEALEQRVRGVGPAVVRALDGHVTFSTSRRPSRAVDPPAGGPRR